MNACSFSLQPFSETGPASSLKIAGEISRVSNRLAIHYALVGHLAEIVVPMQEEIAVRKNAIWKETCFEFFIAAKGSSRYLEFNLSSAGHWNVYSFTEYRQGMQEDAAVHSLPFRVHILPEALLLFMNIDLDGIFRGDQALEVGISAVIKHGDGMLSHWSLFHPGPQADFHSRDGFLIEL